jgi:hypothetical protein
VEFLVEFLSCTDVFGVHIFSHACWLPHSDSAPRGP